MTISATEYPNQGFDIGCLNIKVKRVQRVTLTGRFSNGSTRTVEVSLRMNDFVKIGNWSGAWMMFEVYEQLNLITNTYTDFSDAGVQPVPLDIL